jgi:choline dehydrogenase-like flavoprotein
MDARALRDGDAITADLCVVGAGAAGLSVALELLGAPIRVLLLERGGTADRPGREGIYRVVDGSPPCLDVDPDRVGYVGGATNHWFGNCRPLDQDDFERREWIPDSGWPFRRDELVPFYERAQELLGLGGFRLYDLDACRPHLAHQPLDLPPGVLVHRVLQTCPQPRLAALHRRRLHDAANVQVAAGARVTHLETNDRGDTVRAAHAVAGGRRLRVTARVFVLAAGGIENPRLLLDSTDSDAAGLGNRHDLVGRFFMEHKFVDVSIGPWSRDRDVSFHSRAQPVGPALIWGHLSLSAGFMRAERVPGLSLWFLAAESPTPSVASAIRLKNLLLGRVRGATPLRDLRATLGAPREVGRRTWQKLRGRRGTPGQALRIEVEQTPAPGNRVLLSRKRDRSGRRGVALALRVTDEEMRRHARSLKAAADAIGLDGPRIATTMEALFGGGRAGYFSHHMGTTRMAVDPRKGVVDPDCRVHGVSNLFVAGSSVFPTGGTAGPTLTIVALAVRLARHLQQGHL